MCFDIVLPFLGEAVEKQVLVDRPLDATQAVGRFAARLEDGLMISGNFKVLFGVFVLLCFYAVF